MRNNRHNSATSAAALLGALPDELRAAADARRLCERLADLFDARSPADRVDALIRALRFMLGRPGVAETIGAAVVLEDVDELDDDSADEARPRLDFCLQALEATPAIGRRFGRSVADALRDSSAIGLLADAGISAYRGFFAEFGDRLSERLVPRPRRSRSLRTVLRHLVDSEAGVERLRRLHPESFARLARLTFDGADAERVEPLRIAFADSFRLLALRVASEGLSRPLRMRAERRDLLEVPFMRLVKASERLLDAWTSGEPLDDAARDWRRVCAACSEEIRAIRRQLEAEGVSVDIVYALDVLERCLVRMRAMLEVLEAPDEAARLGAIHRLFARLLSHNLRDTSLRVLVRQNTRLLQRRIVERSGTIGEHYVVSDRAAYRRLWLAAAGGGLLTTLTAVVKLEIHSWHLAPLAEGLSFGINYAVSFLLLQRFGFVLATKQPAMTTAALASIMRERRGRARTDEIVDFAAGISRSQLAAAAGNVMFVALGAYALQELWHLLLDRPMVTAESAQAVYQALSPIGSLTVFYAALTGVLLWLATLIGGWFDNWAAYHHVADGLAEHPLARRLTPERVARWAEAFRTGAAGWATSIALGLLLGLVPAIGRTLGIPLDVRHVTLNSGILAVAASSLDVDWFRGGQFVLAVTGVATMFVLNLSVSFLLSLFTAAGAWGMPAREVVLLLRT